MVEIHEENFIHCLVTKWVTAVSPCKASLYHFTHRLLGTDCYNEREAKKKKKKVCASNPYHNSSLSLSTSNTQEASDFSQVIWSF